MSKIKSHPSGHGYLTYSTDSIEETFRVDENMRDFIREKANCIFYDSAQGSFKYRIPRGPNKGMNTTLSKYLYRTFKSKRAMNDITTVKFVNGLKNDYRLSNLSMART